MLTLEAAEISLQAGFGKTYSRMWVEESCGK